MASVDQECPHCRTHIPAGASICTGCGAREGYASPGDSRNRIVMGLVLAVAVALMSPFIFGSTGVLYFTVPVCLVLILIGANHLRRGPRWFR